MALNSGPSDQGMDGQPFTGFSSSNVSAAQYDSGHNYLKLGFKNGGHYGYHNVSPAEAQSLYGAESKGKWVWDHLRRRGTVYGYQKPYALIGGLSAASGYQPKYYQSHYAEHKAIGPGGRGPAQGAEEEAMAHMKVPIAERAPRKSFVGSLWAGLKSMFGGEHKAQGGEVHGDASQGDNVPIQATAGEFVVPKHIAEQNRPLLEALVRGGGGQGGHYALGGVVKRLGTYAAGAARGYLGSQGGLAGAISAAFGIPKGPEGAGHSQGPDALVGAAEMLKDAARHLSDAATQMSGHGPAAGSTLSSSQWITNKKGVPQLFPKFGPGSIPTATAAGGEAAAGAGAAGPIGIAVLAGAMALTKLKDAAMGVTNLFKDMVVNPAGVIRGMTSPFQSQVGALNPAVIERFNLALDNVSASVGKIFMPIIEEARKFADEINVLMTSSEELKGIFEDLIPPIKDFLREGLVGFVEMLKSGAADLRPIFRELAPLGKAGGEVFKALFSIVGDGVTIVTSLFTIVNDIAKVFGMDLKTATQTLAATFIVAAEMLKEAIDDFKSGRIASGSTIGSIGGMAGGAGIGALLGTPFGPLGMLAGLYFGATRGAAVGGAIGGAIHPSPAGLTFEQRMERVMARLNTPSTPLVGQQTHAAQPARQIGIEELGQQARAAAYSMGPDAATQTAQNTQQTVDALRQIQARLVGWLSFFNPQPQPAME